MHEARTHVMPSTEHTIVKACVKVLLYGEGDDPAKMTDTKMAFSSRLPAVTILKNQICVHSYHLHDVEPMSVYHAEFLYAVMYAATLLCGCQKRERRMSMLARDCREMMAMAQGALLR